MIFIHSSFRTSSTYVWSALRRMPGVTAYYEIFQEVLAGLTADRVNAFSPNDWASGHPNGAPYFLEYIPLLQESGGVSGFLPEMSYRNFIPAAGIQADITAAEQDYVGHLIGHAEQNGRIPVLTCTRTLGRLPGLKRAHAGLHVLLYRNIFQQWCSFTELALRGNTYFLPRILEIVALSQHDPMLRQLAQIFPVKTADITSANTFYLFVFLHLYLYVHAAGAADLILDSNRMAQDAGYRAGIEDVFASQSVPVRFADIAEFSAFSLCGLGQQADVEEHLRAVGDSVIATAPDETGRLFGEKIIDDLITEYRRQLGRKDRLFAALTAPDNIVQRFQAQSDAVGELHQTISAQAGENAGLKQHIAQMAAEQAAMAEAQAATQHQDAAEKAGLAAQIQTLTDQLQALALEKDALVQSHTQSHAALLAEHEAAVARLRSDTAALRLQLTQERDRLYETCDMLRRDLATVQDWWRRDLSAIMLSRSWRFSRFLRKWGLCRPNRPPRPALAADTAGENARHSHGNLASCARA